MKTVFYTIISDSHYHGCRTDDFIRSFKKFHDISLVVFGQDDIDFHFGQHPELNFYNCKAYFAKLLYTKYDLVVNIDADHLIFGKLHSILAGDYDVACPSSYSVSANVGLSITTIVTSNDIRATAGKEVVNIIPEGQYFQGGLIASTSKRFWDIYNEVALKCSMPFWFKENDILNIVLYLFDFKTKYLDGHFDFRNDNFKEFYGCASLGQESDFYVHKNKIMLGKHPVKAYHFAWGGSQKPHPKELFRPEVVDFIYNKIVV